MSTDLFSWLLDIPKLFARFGSWLVSPLAEPYIKLSPLALFSIAGFGVLISIIVYHIVRFFI